MKKVYLYTGVFILLIVALFIIESSIPKPIDWSPTFNETHKKPFGTFVLHSELQNLFPGSSNEDVFKTPYEKLSYENNCHNTTYLFIDGDNSLDTESIDQLLNFVYEGNKVFISACSMPYYLLDTLDVSIKEQHDYDLNNDSIKKPLYFSNKKLTTKYEFDFGFSRSYFRKYNTKTTQALGFHSFDNEEYVNYIKVNYGKGNFFLHTQPFAFTNYHLLKDNHAGYVSDVFSYLDNETILWDSKINSGEEGTGNLDFILREPSLRFAWRLALTGILIFVFFMARRRQRIVPVIEKLPNTSVDFVKTIGNLYYQEGMAKDIVTKKITFFLERIRNTYLIDTSVLNDDFKKRLQQKTGVPDKDINKLINYIVFLNNMTEINEVHLIDLNKLIDNFNRKTL